MKQFVKNILSLGITSALSLSVISYSHAATYEVVDKGNAENLEYTYGKKQNNQGVMAVSGTNIYNFPVQFQYFTDADFNSISYLALTRHDYEYGLEPIEDMEAMKEGNPTANDLAWAKMYLKAESTSSRNLYFTYQMIGDFAAMTNLGEGSQSTEFRVFDTAFDGSYSADSILTRSTIDVIEGVSDSGITFGTATAPYLPMEEFANISGILVQHWLRAHGQRGFFSPDNGETIFPVMPIETKYGGGISAIFDMNENGVAVGYSSYKISEFRRDYILDDSTGCEEPNRYNIPYDICVQYHQSGMYHIQAFKASVSAEGNVETEQLGLLITPHEDDDRGFSSQALAVNNHGVTVGYSHGWDSNSVTTPSATERMTGSYAVIFKEDESGNKEVFDFNQQHYAFGYGSIYPFSKAHDINDSGLVVGYSRAVDFDLGKRFFYVDSSVSNSEMKIVIPDGFFNSSESTAFSVNSAGIIVGEAEIETHNDSSDNPRRTTGFMFDTSQESPKIIDVNTLISCKSAYNILKVNDINDEGEMSATAIVKEQRYDAKGQPIEGEQIDVVRAVVLKPIPDDGEAPCSETEKKVERQGASFAGFTLISLLSILGLRRRRFLN
jgi:hypothetical protein